MTLPPDRDYRDYPEYANLSRKELRQIIFLQGLGAPEDYLGESPYEGEQAGWWYEGKSFWGEQEEGGRLEEHRYFKGG